DHSIIHTPLSRNSVFVRERRVSFCFTCSRPRLRSPETRRSCLHPPIQVEHRGPRDFRSIATHKCDTTTRKRETFPGSVESFPQAFPWHRRCTILPRQDHSRREQR